MRKIEILAPAGSYESIVAAINAKADAVYIGGSKFGARAYANNLTEEDMLRAIDYVHLHGRNIYLTVNTLLKNSELENDLYHYLAKYYKQGLDAVIVQDVGVLHFINEHFKELPIHASTQMTLTMANGLSVFKNRGVTRLVTSRELNLAEIKSIRENTDLEIESFVHGALCYCYSGQCLMSSMLGGRSGNRGRCAQPCRMPYDLIQNGNTISSNEDKYLLSPKDMSALSIIPQLIEAGIDSFKIEGRMKRPEYTAIVVSKYRKYVDIYTNLGKQEYASYLLSHKCEYEKDLQELMDIYNRGSFTKGYYTAHNGKDMLSMNRPNHNGIFVGEIIDVKGIRAEILLKENIYPQDLLEIREGNAGIYEFTVKNKSKAGSKIQTNFMPKSGVKKGQLIYRTKNQNLLDKTKEQFIDNSIKENIQGEFIAQVGKPMSLKVSLHDQQVKVYGEFVESALKQPMTEDKIRTQLCKTSASEFVFNTLEITVEDNIFIPLVKINELRREALGKLEIHITEQYRRPLDEHTMNNLEYTMNNPDYRTNLAEYIVKESPNIQENSKADTQKDIGISVNLLDTRLLDTVIAVHEIDNIYLEVADIELSNIPTIAMKVHDYKKNLYLVMPHIFRMETYNIFLKNKEYIWGDSKEYIKGFIIKNFEEYEYLTNDLDVSPSKIILDYNVYTMNKESKNFYGELGIKHYTTSVELNYSELKNLGCEDSDIIVYGYLPLMVSAQCLLKTTKGCTKKSEVINLIDRYNKTFYVRNYCKYCYNVIYNGLPISLLNNSKEINGLKPKNIRLNFTIENQNEVIDILNGYIDVYRHHKSTSLEIKEYTRGHFKRGIE